MALGVPFVDKGRDPSGWDCWGLVLWHYTARGIALPDRPEVSALDAPEVSQAAYKGLSEGPWLRVVRPLEVDLAIVWRHYRSADGRMILAPLHCGLVTRPGHILHCDEDTGTVDVPADHRSLLSRRVDYWRWAA